MVADDKGLLVIFLDIDGVICCNEKGRLESEQMQQLARENFNSAINLDPNAAEPYLGRGQTELALGNPDDALTDFERALEIDSESADAWAYRGVVLERQGRNGEAYSSYNRALQLNPGLPLAK